MSRKDAELYTATKELIATPSQSVQNKAELSRLLNIPRTTMLLMFQAEGKRASQIENEMLLSVWLKVTDVLS